MHVVSELDQSVGGGRAEPECFGSTGASPNFSTKRMRSGCGRARWPVSAVAAARQVHRIAGALTHSSRNWTDHFAIEHQLRKTVAMKNATNRWF